MSSPTEPPDEDEAEPQNESTEAVLSGDDDSLSHTQLESIDELGRTIPAEDSSNALSPPKPAQRKKRRSSRPNLASLSALPVLMPSFLDTIQESDDVDRSDTSSAVDHSSTLGSSVVSSGFGGSLSDVRNNNFKRWWHVLGNAPLNALSERSDLGSTGAGLEFGSFTGGSDVHPTSSTKEEVIQAMGVDKGVPVTAVRPPQQRGTRWSNMEERVVAFCMGYRNIIMFALLCITILIASLMITTSHNRDSKGDGAFFDNTFGNGNNLRNPTVAPTLVGVAITESPVTMPLTLSPIGEGETYAPTVVTRRPTNAPTTKPKPTQSPTTSMPSRSPTVAPETQEQQVAMLEFLDRISGDALMDPDSAASRARTWLLEEDPVTLKLAFNGDAGSTTTRVAQRFVLAVFYFSLNGNSWINKGRLLEQEASSIGSYRPELEGNVPVDFGIHRELTGASSGEPFLSGMHECEWEGITCRPASVSYADGNVVEERVVSSVILPSRNLQGTLPGKEMELGLSYLKQLSIYANRISGTIPEEFMNNMRFLDWLDLGENRMTGQVPAIGPKMRFLYLSSNRLSGEIPPLQETNEEYKLTHLWMQENMLSGSIPASLASLVNLELLILYSNSLAGLIPKDIGDWSKLIHLDLSYNSFTGSLPRELFDLKNLEYLYLDDNDLTGTIPNTIKYLTNLKAMWISNNAFTGNDFGRGFRSLKQLETLFFQGNDITGITEGNICPLKSENGGQLIDLTADCNITGQDEDGNNIFKVRCHCCTECF